jgi:hypothetical protein
LMKFKFCKDCENYVYSHNYWDTDLYSCSRLRMQDKRIDLVTGEISYKKKFLNCKDERSPGGDCGPEGKYWEEKKC